MRRTDLPATKSTLLRLREHFATVRAGHQLLEQKREVLLEELLQIAREARAARRQLAGALGRAYDTLRRALVTDGRGRVEADALAAGPPPALSVRERSIMGVAVPLLSIETSAPSAPVVAGGTGSPGSAFVARQVRALLPALVRQAELEMACRRLAAELRKTQRRVNALETVFIPEYRDTIRFIEALLEEKEREGLFQLKRLKGRRAEPGGGESGHG